jgi:hypothetical protein
MSCGADVTDGAYTSGQGKDRCGFVRGPLEVQGDDGALSLGGIKLRAVLAVLSHRNEPVSAERLALALWGENTPGGRRRPCRSVTEREGLHTLDAIVPPTMHPRSTPPVRRV